MITRALILLTPVALLALACDPVSNAQASAASGDEQATDDARRDRPGKAPAQYSVKLETTAGDIVIDVTRAWAPRGADRFHELVESDFYDNVAFFRVIKGFMAQTGISGSPAVNEQWRNKRIQDDPVRRNNTRGMVSFATSGPNSRTTQFFINSSNNHRLDTMGFAPFGRVRDMDAVDSLYSGYGEGAPRGRGPSQSRLTREGNAYLQQHFPQLDYIRQATILSQ